MFTKIGKIKHKIIQWVKEQNQNSDLAIIKTQRELEEALSSSTPDSSLIASLSASLEAAYKEEELFWRQRSRIQWLHSGDRNTNFSMQLLEDEELSTSSQ